MSPPKNKNGKPFDCVKFKHEVQSRIYEETKHLSSQDHLIYFRRAVESGPLNKWWKSIRNAKHTRAAQ